MNWVLVKINQEFFDFLFIFSLNQMIYSWKNDFKIVLMNWVLMIYSWKKDFNIYELSSAKN